MRQTTRSFNPHGPAPGLARHVLHTRYASLNPRLPGAAPVAVLSFQKLRKHVRCTTPGPAVARGAGSWATRSVTAQLAKANDRQQRKKQPAVKQSRSRTAPAIPELAVLRVKKLQSAIDLPEALERLSKAVLECASEMGPYGSGLMRLEVSLPPGTPALSWLKTQSHLASKMPSVYFSPRRTAATSTQGGVLAGKCLEGWQAVAGLGAAWEWKGEEFTPFSGGILKGIRRFLISSEPQLRVLGGTRFDVDQAASEEWLPFGSFTFILPGLEMAEAPNSTILSYNLAWQPQATPSPELGFGPVSVQEAVDRAIGIIKNVAPFESNSALAPHLQRTSMQQHPDRQGWKKLMSSTLACLADTSINSFDLPGQDNSLLQDEFFSEGQQGLDSLLNALSSSMNGTHFNSEVEDLLTKVVLARKTDIEVKGRLDPWDLLSTLQDQNPRAYQISLSIPGGGSFVGSTPERLFSRSGKHIATEAVAGTRPRGPEGDLEQDFQLGLDLLQSPKDHVEFTIVREWLKVALEQVCSKVDVEVPKSLLRQAAVQHLYSKLSGTLADGKNDADILSLLHPTPAVCGCTREPAFHFLRENEPFDRGFYAGPFGWISGEGAEFVVAIRSALIRQPSPSAAAPQAPHTSQSHTISLFGGVGIVPESDASLEWQELNLKINQYDRLLVQQESPLAQQNINMAWTTSLVEELCRIGISTFGVAPGSRSSPLTLAVASHPRATIVPCIDERSLGFWALGFAKSTGLPAPIITSSGTAVANLLPAVVEASMSHVPMLLLTADRPAELRAAGANQAIDQVKIFGDYTKLAHDLPPPNQSTPLRLILTSIDNAVHVARSHPCGPVHLNCQFQEPLAPIQTPYKLMDSDIVERWWSSWKPFTTSVDVSSSGGSESSSEGIQKVLQLTSGMEKCLLVIGKLQSAKEIQAAKKLVSALGWPAIADVLSGLRIGQGGTENLIFHADHILVDREEIWSALKPDAVLQLGGRLTSKRLGAFLEASATAPSNRPMTWIHVSQNPYRDDPVHLATHKIECSIQSLVPAATYEPISESSHKKSYARTWKTIDVAVERSITLALEHKCDAIVEPLVARIVSNTLPAGNGLFVGNSMPIRDMDMYSGSLNNAGPVMVAANRGASGIDGVLSTAIGFSQGLNRPTTLVLGDVSFLHDINGLSLLKSGKNIPPLTIVLINNSGGGIFDFLPVANSVPPTTFSTLWSTPQHVDIKATCRSHGVLHQSATSASELESALMMAWRANDHSVVEVVTNKKSNVDVHQRLQAAAADASKNALQCANSSRGKNFKVQRVRWQQYKLPIIGATTNNSPHSCRHGLIVTVEIKSANGQVYTGRGDVCPLQGVHRESLVEVTREIACLGRLAEGTEVPLSLGFLQGGFADWFDKHLGIAATDLSPSLRFGMEMAVSCAVSSACGTDHSVDASSTSDSSHTRDSIEICGLVDPKDDLDHAVLQAKELVEQGYRTLKIKVARGLSPEADARLVAAIRCAVGSHVRLRCDANRGWSMHQALVFAGTLDRTEIEYIEEPIDQVEQIQDFIRISGMNCALDETLIESACKGFFNLSDLAVEGIVAWVVKPSLLGSLDSLIRLTEQSKESGIDLVISSVFESCLGLSFLSGLAHQVNKITGKSPAHGLGTARWFKADVIDWTASRMQRNLLLQPFIALKDLGMVLNSTSFDTLCNWKVVGATSQIEEVSNSMLQYGRDSFCVSNADLPTLANSAGPLVVFIHGFMGSRVDWEPIMDKLRDHKCIAIDLPGHGDTYWNDLQSCSVESVASALISGLEGLGVQSCVVVGYSLGARVALQMAALCTDKSLRIQKVVSISGSAGILDSVQRQARAVQDSKLARKIETDGLGRFVDHWYQGLLWEGLRQRPGLFQKMLRRRKNMGELHMNSRAPSQQEDKLASALVSLSTGKMAPLHQALKTCKSQLLLIAGAKDEKFCRIGKHLDNFLKEDQQKASKSKKQSGNTFCKSQYVEVPECGHAIHLERPMLLAKILSTFLD